MKKLTEEEFRDRAMALHMARKIFIESGLTNNITHAFEAYQKICADKERQIFLATQAQGNRPQTIMDKYERLKCPNCGGDLMFRNVPENDKGIKIQLVCSNKDCDTVISDTHDINWWMQNLEVKKEE